jgi:Rab GDP dissociation inhibitor
MLLHTKVTRYLEWKCVEASYVCQHQKGGMFSSEKMAVCKFPSDTMEAANQALWVFGKKKKND